jgi:HSP20 family protein
LSNHARRPARSPLAEALELQERLNRLLERALDGSAPNARRSAPALPAVDLLETPRSFVLTADLPGIVPASLEIALGPLALSFGGRLREGGGRPRRFRRRIALPTEIDPELSRGSLRCGVLRLRLAKKRRLALVPRAARRPAAARS